MPISIQFPKTLEVKREKVTIPLLPQRIPVEKETAALARAMAMKGPLVDEGALYSLTTETALLHHFHASDSMRWCQLPVRGRSHKVAALDIRDEKELRGIAEKYLAKLGLLDKEAAFAAIIYGAVESAGGRSKEGAATVTSAFVNFSYTFDGLPVVGSGAKAQVEIGPQGAVVSCYRFWRNVTRGKEPLRQEPRPVISWEAAQKTFSRDPAFAQLDNSAEVVVDTARLAYMAMPPRDMQGVLFPVYEMRGSVTTRAFKKKPFRRYVVALDYSTDDLKKYGVANIHLG
jgi:hypothetical protein